VNNLSLLILSLALCACTSDCAPLVVCTVHCWSDEGYTHLDTRVYPPGWAAARYQCEEDYIGTEGCWSIDCDCRD